MKSILTLCFLITLLPATGRPADDLEYPQIMHTAQGTLQVHHPVIDTWDDYAEVEGWIPVEVQLTGSETRYVGAVRARARTSVDLAERLVTLSEQQVLDVRFSQEDAPDAARELAHAAVKNRPIVVVLDAMLGVLADSFQPPAQNPNPGLLNHQPPRIVVATEPTGLLLIDKEPILARISGTGLEFVINTDWPLFRHTERKQWYVVNEGFWQTHSMLATGGWRTTVELPEDFRQLAMVERWATVRNALPPAQPPQDPSPFIVSLEPTEMLLIDGPARLETIGEADLAYVTNTDRDLFRSGDRWYLLLAGRWFEAAALDKAWRLVDALPETFTSIPATHPKARVRSAIPGTVESVIAMMVATLPQQREVNDADAAELAVVYAGAPQFEPIEGTTLERALNSPGYVFRHNNFYYLCHDAAWFLSRNPDGPWSVADRVPDEIYDIPASDPAYFVTFVRPVAQDNAPPNRAVFEFNRGYFGEFSTGVTVVQGTGWYYSPWVGYDPVGMPVYWSHPYTYGWHGYGPYGSRFYHYGGYWSSHTVEWESAPVGFGGGSYDPAFQDPQLARRGYDYTTIEENRERELGRSLNADDDYYTDAEGNVYRQQGGDWSRHTGEGWSTMAELERQYGGSAYGKVGDVGAPQQQRQAYKQNPNDIERIKRWHERRSRSYNMHGYVTVYR